MAFCYCKPIKEIMSDNNEKDAITRIESLMQFVTGMFPNAVYSNDFEYHFLMDRWGKIGDYLSMTNYKKLIFGLDEESVRLVDRTIRRIQRILLSGDSPVDLFDREEMNEIYYIRHSFLSEIIKLEENIYAFRNYILPLPHFEKGIFIDEHGIKNMNIDSFKTKSIIDVGAYIGDSALVLSKYTKKKVYSFEPLKENYDLMKKTIEYNNLTNIETYNYALGKNEGTSLAHNLYEDIASGSCCTIVSDADESDNTTPVSVRRLDDFQKEKNIQIGLIKIDVEGAEQDFLEGAKETICSQKPALIVSIYHNPHDFFCLKPLLEQWVPEYRFKLFKPVDECGVLDTVLLCECENHKKNPFRKYS